MHVLHSTDNSTDNNVQTGELVIEDAMVFWKPPPMQDCPQPQVIEKKVKWTKQVWWHFVEMEVAPGLSVEPGQMVIVQVNSTLLLEKMQLSHWRQ